MKAAPLNLTRGLLLSLIFVGCIGRPPLRTYTIARTAIESAKKADGARVASEDLHKAEESYRKGEYYFRDKDYASAAASFEDAIEYAETVENKARLPSQKPRE